MKTCGMLLLVGCLLANMAMGQVETENRAKWYVCPGLGYYLFEGDEEVESGYTLNARVGYDYSEWWTFEGVLTYAPALEVVYPDL